MIQILIIFQLGYDLFALLCKLAEFLAYLYNTKNRVVVLNNKTSKQIREEDNSFLLRCVFSLTLL